MAKVQKGCAANVFPPLRNSADQLVDHPANKAKILCDKFFPGTPRKVLTIQPQDPQPRPTRHWEPITPEDVTAAL